MLGLLDVHRAISAGMKQAIKRAGEGQTCSDFVRIFVPKVAIPTIGVARLHGRALRLCTL